MLLLLNRQYVEKVLNVKSICIGAFVKYEVHEADCYLALVLLK